MILSYEEKRGGIFLCEVANEDEAFFEMRRFLEINKINSDYTEVTWKDVNPNYDICARHKRVNMCCSHGGGASFGIYYEGGPKYAELGNEDNWGIKREGLIAYNDSYHYKHSTHEFVCWYDEVALFLADKAMRKAGAN